MDILVASSNRHTLVLEEDFNTIVEAMLMQDTLITHIFQYIYIVMKFTYLALKLIELVAN